MGEQIIFRKNKWALRRTYRRYSLWQCLSWYGVNFFYLLSCGKTQLSLVDVIPREEIYDKILVVFIFFWRCLFHQMRRVFVDSQISSSQINSYSRASYFGLSYCHVLHNHITDVILSTKLYSKKSTMFQMSAHRTIQKCP